MNPLNTGFSVSSSVWHGRLVRDIIIARKSIKIKPYSLDFLVYRLYTTCIYIVKGVYMAKDMVLPVRIDPELKAVFLKVAEMEDRPASQIVRELIREYVKSHAQLDLIEGKGRSKK